MSGFTGLTKLFGESSTRATICLANREAAHKGILPQYIYILFPKEMQFNEQKYCAEEAEDLKQRAGATNTCSAWISGSTNQNNCISLMENIIFERYINCEAETDLHMVLNPLYSLICCCFHHAAEEKRTSRYLQCVWRDSGSEEGRWVRLSWRHTYIWSLHTGKRLNNGRRGSACFLIYSVNVRRYEALTGLEKLSYGSQ